MTNPILTEDYRGTVLESFHRGVICVVDSEEKVLLSEGAIHQQCYPRSALKFFQQLPLLLSGAAKAFDFSNKELAVMCGSHNAEEEHIKTVDSILSKIGLDRSNLKCGAQYPSDKSTANALIAKNEKPTAIHNNCSGKHAGFLAYSVFLGADINGYLNAQHPTQIAIRNLVADFHSVKPESLESALDGCSAPIYPLSVYQQALGYMRLVNPKFGDSALRSACDRIVSAVREHPFMVAGSKRYCSELMIQCGDQVIGKTGAEGIYSLAFHQLAIGACIKIDDGKMHPQYQVAQKLVSMSGLFTKESLSPLKHYIEEPIQNFNKLETGFSRVAPNILREPWR